jgi:hypothetical protein
MMRVVAERALEGVVDASGEGPGYGARAVAQGGGDRSAEVLSTDERGHDLARESRGTSARRGSRARRGGRVRRRVRGGRRRRGVVDRAWSGGRMVVVGLKRRPGMGWWRVVLWGRKRGGRRRRRRMRNGLSELRGWLNGLEQGSGLLFEIIRGECAAEEDVLPPDSEGQEEEQVSAVDGAGDVAASVGGGDAGDDGGYRGAVSGEVGELLVTSAFDLGDHPLQGAGGAVGHDESDAHPEVVDVGAAKLPGAGEAGAHVVHWV